MSDGIVIAGGGLAAQRCVETLRAQGHDGPIRVVCGEPHAPYDRPPLSKELLAGELPPVAAALRPSAWYEGRGINLLLGTGAVRLEAGRRRLELSDARTLRFDKLLIATGSRARTLASLHGYSNVGVLRTIDDAIALRRALAPGARLAVVGAGFIGLEVAATARTLAAEVTIVEALEAPLAAALGPALGRWFAKLHRAHGVDVRTGARIERVLARGDRVHALVLADGSRVDCDHVLVGTGVDPDTRWLESSGLAPDGVRVDAEGRTAVRSVFAAGDAACVHDAVVGRHVRTDHWEAAARQGAAAGRAMLGLEPRPSPLPSFWSDQYGVRSQYLGRREVADGMSITGDPAACDFEATFTKSGVPVAALLVGRPRGLAEARRRVQAGLQTVLPRQKELAA